MSGENFRLKPSSHWVSTPSLTLALLLDSGDYSLSKLLIKLMNFPSQNAPDRTERVCVCFSPFHYLKRDIQSMKTIKERLMSSRV